MAVPDDAATPHDSPGDSLPPGEYFSPPQLARLLGVDPSTVRRWLDAGYLPWHRAGPSRRARRRIVRADAERFVREYGRGMGRVLP